MGLFGGFGFDTPDDLWEYVESASWPTGFCDRSMHSFAGAFGYWVSLGVPFSFAGGLMGCGIDQKKTWAF